MRWPRWWRGSPARVRPPRRPATDGGPAARGLWDRLRWTDGPRRRNGLAPQHPRHGADFPLRDRVRELTGLPTALDNDAKALALGEGWVGAARGCRNFLAMVVSTGVGGGIVLDGRLVDGASGNAGHVGHVIVEPDGRLLRVRRPGLSRSRSVGDGHRRRHRAAAGRGVPGPSSSGADSWSDGRWRRSSSAARRRAHRGGGSVALGYGAPFFVAANDELRARACLSFTPFGHASSPPDWPNGDRSWGPAPSDWDQ